jgi:predicted transglutaminase-like cysteine proteinase
MASLAGGATFHCGQSESDGRLTKYRECRARQKSVAVITDMDRPQQTPPLFPRRARRLRRWVVKTLAFALFALVVLNPNLKRGWLQIDHTLHPDALVDRQFPALVDINKQIDRFVAADAGSRSEPRLVARFVLKKIKYVSDYENWDNLEYWPTPQEVWDRRQEDCDGRAILATCILRARGFCSAHLVIGLDHMWIRVNENEKVPTLPPQYISLLDPSGDLNLELRDGPTGGDVARVLRALVHPTALRETSTHLFADIPALRKAILMVALVLLCLHPCKHSTALLGLSATSLAGVALLADWQPGSGNALLAGLGGILLFVALAASALMGRMLQRRSRAVAVPETGKRLVLCA